MTHLNKIVTYQYCQNETKVLSVCPSINIPPFSCGGPLFFCTSASVCLNLARSSDMISRSFLLFREIIITILINNAHVQSSINLEVRQAFPDVGKEPEG